MRRPRPPIFLERRSYRQRRLRDAAHMLPLLGLALWALPLLFAADGVPAQTSRALLYIFGVWVGLVAAAAALARALDPVPGQDDPVADPDDTGYAVPAPDPEALSPDQPQATRPPREG